MKYSLRPQLIDAEQYFEGARSAFLLKALQACDCREKGACTFCGKVYVQTASGPKVVNDGDYVIQTAGVYSVLKPEQFVELYKKEH